MTFHTQKTGRFFGPERPCLQPLAVALVCMVLIILFLIMGIMNLRTLDKTLVGFTENKGAGILKEVRVSAREYFQQLEGARQNLSDSDTETYFNESNVSLQESFLINLMNLAREIDLNTASDPFTPEQLTTLAHEKYLSLIACLDKKGDMVIQTGPVSEDILAIADPVIRRDEMFKISVSDRSRNKKKPRVIALGRKSGRGAVILALDDRGFRYRRLYFSLQKAIEERNRGDEEICLMLTDTHNHLIAWAGELSDKIAEQIRHEPVFKTRVTSRKITTRGRNLLEIASPLQLSGEFAGMMRLCLDSDETEQILDKSRRTIFISVSFMGIIAVLSLWLLYKNQKRYTERIRAMERRIQQTQRLSAMGRLAAGVAHEIRNPLNAISIGIQRIQRETPHKLTSMLRDEIRRLNQIIEDFLSISKTGKLELNPYDLTILLQQVVMLMGEEAESKGIRLITRWPDNPLIISADPDKMKQAFLNIVKNAIEAVHDKGDVTIGVKSEERQGIRVEISDTGPGLSGEEIRHIFDPDYTTKEKGLGLGLTIAYEIVRAHGGNIHVTGHPGKGTVFEIQLPFGDL